MHARFFNTDADYDHSSEVYRVVNIERHQVKSAADRKDGKIYCLALCIAQNGLMKLVTTTV